MISRSSFALGAAALSTAALLAPSELRAAPDVMPVVNVGTTPLDVTGLVYYAYDLGYFKKAGLDVRIQEFRAGPQTAAALASGAIDIAVSNPTSIAAGHLREIDLKFIAPSAIATEQTKTDQMIVAKDSAIYKAEDLNGKTVAIGGIKSLQQVLAMAWTDKHGGNSKSLQFLEIPFPQMGATVTAHRVNAAMMTEPFVSAAEETTRSLGNVLDSFGSPFMITGYCARMPWLVANAAKAARFVAVIRDTAAWANTHHSESGAILARYAKLDPSVLATMARSTYGLVMAPAMVQPVIDNSAKYGIIDKSFPASEIIWQPPRA